MKLFTVFLCSMISVRAADQTLSQEQANQQIKQSFELIAKENPSASLPGTRPAVLGPGEPGKPPQIAVRKLALGEHEMPYAVVVKGAVDKPLPLFIAMHGGGQDPKQPGPHTWQVNTREFEAQIKFSVGLYQPDGIYFIPRMADDRLGRWWHKHNQKAFDQVIDTAILRWNADPNRVYLMGVSEGGYGTDILAPFMADRWAGANAMAAGVGLGNPPANLRNVAFRTDVGENDTMFDRRPMAVAFHQELDRLHAADPAGYAHSINVQPGRGHGIDYSKGIQWIATHTRNPWPEKIVWINQPMDGLRRERFYWVEMTGAPEKGDIRVDATADRATNTVTLGVSTLVGDNTDGNRTHGKDNVAEAPRTPMTGAKVNLLLSDSLLDLDKPVTVVCNGKQVFSAKVPRSAAVISAALAKRPDPAACPTARVEITVP